MNTSYYGKYRGTVVDNADPQQLGRLQVRVPQVSGNDPISWAMPCVPYAGPGVGFFMLPPVGAKVWIEFEGGDADYPIWVGGFWEQTNDIPASPPTPDMKIIKTGTATLLLNETQGAEAVTIETSSGKKIILNDQGIEFDDGQGATIKLQGPTTSINGNALEVT